MPQVPENLHWIPADWPAPKNIHAGTTTRIGGYSHGAWSGMNLAMHVGDNAEHVFQNRILLKEFLSLPGEPHWLEQIHSNKVLNLTTETDVHPADGAYTNHQNQVCGVLTADCLPLLICNTAGTEIAAIHVGWRGFSTNIISSALNNFSAKPEDLIAWIGPYISASHYEVGEDVRTACLRIINDPEDAFIQSRPGHWFADLKKLVMVQLRSTGLQEIHGGEYCTYTDNQHFYSYRRDGITGRIASLIWMHT
jgi:polyphenol oxidase